MSFSPELQTRKADWVFIHTYIVWLQSGFFSLGKIHFKVA